MNEEDLYEEELEEIEEDWVKDINRLAELKEMKAAIEAEISHINDSAAAAGLRGKFTDAEGNEYKVTLRQDMNAPKVTDARALAAEFPELWGAIASVQVDNTRLKEAVKKGYFTNTPAAAYVTQTMKRPWVQVTPLAKEEDTDE